MAKAISVWGIDIGHCGLKALKLTNREGRLTIDAIDIVEHPVVLSHSEGREHDLIRTALETFQSRNKLAGSRIAVAVPGQSTFSRFVKLPPVESKRIPDIVQFEAEQQIPFPIPDVIWRWQTFQDPDSPDVEVGIFAMKRVDIDQVLGYFNDVGIAVDLVQMAPLCLYNFMTRDKQIAEDGATLLMDLGTAKTELVVSDGPRLWARTIQIGGNNFTEALVKAFKLSFEKAQKLKRSAATSKYARQIFQSMRPVFSDLVQEVQRSIGYYTSLHRETRFRRLIGLGNGFRLPGLQRFLEQNLSIPVVRVDGYTAATPGEEINVPMLTENVQSFAAAYGVALQSVTDVRIQTNLLPREIARKRLWNRKRPWFTAAAAMVVAFFGCMVYRSFVDSRALIDSDTFYEATQIKDELQARKNEYLELRKNTDREGIQINKYLNLFAYRDFWPKAQTLISRAILTKGVADDQGRLATFAGDLQTIISGAAELKTLDQDLDKRVQEILDEPDREKRIKEFTALKAGLQAEQRAVVDRILRAETRCKSFLDIPRPQRKIIFIDRISPNYLPELGGPKQAGAPQPPQPGDEAQRPRGGFSIRMSGQTTLPRAQANDMLSALKRAFVAIAEEKEFESVGFEKLDVQFGTVKPPPAAADPNKIRKPDPLTGEESANDTEIQLTLVLSIRGDGLSKPAAESDRKQEKQH